MGQNFEQSNKLSRPKAARSSLVDVSACVVYDTAYER